MHVHSSPLMLLAPLTLRYVYFRPGLTHKLPVCEPLEEEDRKDGVARKLEEVGKEGVGETIGEVNSVINTHLFELGSHRQQ